MPSGAGSPFCWLLLIAVGSCAGAHVESEPPPSPGLDSSAYASALTRPGTKLTTWGGLRPTPSSNGVGGADAEPEVIEDEASETEATPEPGTEARAHPLDGWGAERIAHTVKQDLKALGSISVGQPNAGALLNGVQAEASPLLELVNAPNAYGTQETLDYLLAAIRSVHAAFPATPPLSLGHISAPRGGPLRPHLSHQSGRDVDLSFFYREGARWYTRASEKNLDLARTWALVKALVTETDVEMILVDRSIQPLLRREALSRGEDAEWLASIFEGSAGKLRPIVRHAPGHATHLHIRFFNPIAQETGRRTHPALVAAGLASELSTFVVHRARRGDTLGKLAKKYGVSVQAIQRANGLRNSRIRERRDYRIPVRARPAPLASSPLKFPARRLPPAPAR